MDGARRFSASNMPSNTLEEASDCSLRCWWSFSGVKKLPGRKYRKYFWPQRLNQGRYGETDGTRRFCAWNMPSDHLEEGSNCSLRCWWPFAGAKKLAVTDFRDLLGNSGRTRWDMAKPRARFDRRRQISLITGRNQSQITIRGHRTRETWSGNKTNQATAGQPNEILRGPWYGLIARIK